VNVDLSSIILSVLSDQKSQRWKTKDSSN